MKLKTSVFLIIGLLILGIIISVISGSVLNLNTMISSTSNDALTTEFLSYCHSKINTYSINPTEVNRRNFCCACMDLNNNGKLEDEEYCTNSCTDCSVQSLTIEELCSEPINYYTNKDSC